MLVVLVAEQAAQAAGGSSGLMGAFKEKPTFLVANLVVSAVVVAMIVERVAFQLSKYSVNSKEFFAQIKKLVTAGNIDRAIKLCDAGDYPTLQLVKAGLTHANKGPDEIDAAMSEKMSELTARGRKARRLALVARQHRHPHRSHRNRRRSDHDVQRRVRSAALGGAAPGAALAAASRRPCTTRRSASASPSPA